MPLNGQETGAISDKYPNLFVPAGITFAVWGVIYLMLALFILYQTGIFTRKSGAHLEVVAKLKWWFIVSCVGNAVWIFMWHYDLIHLSLVAMLVILASLIAIQTKYSASSADKKETWFFYVPFGIYFGWITVATIANVTAVLVHNHWNGFGLSDSVWTIILLLIAAVITLIRTLWQKDIAYALVIIWAFAGVLIKHTTVFETQFPPVIWTVGICIALIAVAVLVSSLMAGAQEKTNRRVDLGFIRIRVHIPGILIIDYGKHFLKCNGDGFAG